MNARYEDRGKSKNVNKQEIVELVEKIHQTLVATSKINDETLRIIADGQSKIAKIRKILVEREAREALMAEGGHKASEPADPGAVGGAVQSQAGEALPATSELPRLPGPESLG